MPVDLNLPVPGQSPNWANQLNNEIEKINNAINQGAYFTSDYGVVGNGTTNDTAALQNMIDTLPDGARIVAPPGARLLLDGVQVVGRSIDLDFSQATLIKNANASVLHVSGTWSEIQSGVTVSPSATSPTSLVSVPNPSAYSAGSVVKVYSNDENTFARNPNDGRYAHLGEFGTVTEVNSSEGWVRISPQLIHDYTDNVRIAKLDDHKVSIKVGDGNYTSAGDPGPEFGHPAFISLVALYRPKVDVEVTASPVALVSRKSNFQDDIRAVSRYAPQDTGYVVNNQNSVGGTIYAKSARCRHTYTDNAIMVTSSSDPSDYGRPMYDVVTTMNIGSDYAGGGFDTHHGGYGHKFINCQAVGSSGRARGGGGAFAIRGMYHELINCSANDVGVGFNFWQETNRPYIPPMGGHRMVGCSTKNADSPISLSKNAWTFPNEQGMDDLYIEGGVFESRASESLFVNGRITFAGATFVMNTPDGIERVDSDLGFQVISHSGGGGLYGNVNVDIRPINGGTFNRVISLRSTGPASNNDLNVDLKVSNWVRNNGLELVGWGGNRGSIRFDLMGSLGVLQTSTDFDKFASEQSITVEERGFNDSIPLTGGSKVQSFSSSANTRIFLHSGDPVVTARVSVSGGNWTPNDVTPAAFPGQVLIIHNRYNSSGNIALSSSVGNMNIGSPFEIAPGMSRQFIWDQDSSGTGRWVRA